MDPIVIQTEKYGNIKLSFDFDKDSDEYKINFTFEKGKIPTESVEFTKLLHLLEKSLKDNKIGVHDVLRTDGEKLFTSTDAELSKDLVKDGKLNLELVNKVAETAKNYVSGIGVALTPLQKKIVEASGEDKSLSSSEIQGLMKDPDFIKILQNKGISKIEVGNYKLDQADFIKFTGEKASGKINLNEIGVKISNDENTTVNKVVPYNISNDGKSFVKE